MLRSPEQKRSSAPAKNFAPQMLFFLPFYQFAAEIYIDLKHPCFFIT
jgi:hypothetical protein